MPVQIGFWFDDQKRFASTCASHCRPEKTENGAVDIRELWLVDLALKDEDLMPESQDLGVTLITCCEQPADSIGG